MKTHSNLVTNLGYTGALLTKLGADNQCIDAANLIRDIAKELSAREWDSDTPGNIARLLVEKGLVLIDYPPEDASGQEIIDALGSLGYEPIAPSSNHQVQLLCKEHLGFEPTIDQQNDVLDTLRGAPDVLEYEVCGSCLMYVAHGEEPTDDPEWDSGTVDDRMRAEENGRQSTWNTGLRPTSADPEGTGHVEFSHYPCELCGAKPGERHGLTLHFKAEPEVKS